jgi:hypothetical protein
LDLRIDQGPQLTGDLPVLREELFGIDRLAAVDALEKFVQRRVDPRIVRFGRG